MRWQGLALIDAQDQRDKMNPGFCIMFGGADSGDDNVPGEPDGETGGDDGVGCVGQVISLYPYVPLTPSQK